MFKYKTFNTTFTVITSRTTITNSTGLNSARILITQKMRVIESHVSDSNIKSRLQEDRFFVTAVIKVVIIHSDDRERLQVRDIQVVRSLLNTKMS